LGGWSRIPKLPDCAQDFTPITQNYADLLQVQIGQLGKHREIDAVFSKALRILGQAEAFQPVRKVLFVSMRRAPRANRCRFWEWE
jgi:hypothetical protein